jgi:hypothetical protein
MPRKKLIRRFDPRFGVSIVAVEVEAKALAREIEGYALLALSDLEAKRVELHAKCKHCWEHLQLLVEGLPERDQCTLHAVLFRDFYHILELYLAHVREIHPQAATTTTGTKKQVAAPAAPFSEWLFGPS